MNQNELSEVKQILHETLSSYHNTYSFYYPDHALMTKLVRKGIGRMHKNQVKDFLKLWTNAAFFKSAEEALCHIGFPKCKHDSILMEWKFFQAIGLLLKNDLFAVGPKEYSFLFNHFFEQIPEYDKTRNYDRYLLPEVREALENGDTARLRFYVDTARNRTSQLRNICHHLIRKNRLKEFYKFVQESNCWNCIDPKVWCSVVRFHFGGLYLRGFQDAFVHPFRYLHTYEFNQKLIRTPGPSAVIWEFLRWNEYLTPEVMLFLLQEGLSPDQPLAPAAKVPMDFTFRAYMEFLYEFGAELPTDNARCLKKLIACANAFHVWNEEKLQKEKWNRK